MNCHPLRMVEPQPKWSANIRGARQQKESVQITLLVTRMCMRRESMGSACVQMRGDPMKHVAQHVACGHSHSRRSINATRESWTHGTRMCSANVRLAYKKNCAHRHRKHKHTKACTRSAHGERESKEVAAFVAYENFFVARLAPFHTRIQLYSRTLTLLLRSYSPYANTT